MKRSVKKNMKQFVVWLLIFILSFGAAFWTMPDVSRAGIVYEDDELSDPSLDEDLSNDALIIEEVLEDETVIPASSLDEPDILLEQYMEEAAVTYVEEAMMGVSEEGSLPKAGARYWKLGSSEQKAYLKIRDIVKQIAAGELNETYITISFSELYDEARYTADDLGVDSIISDTGDTILGEAVASLNGKYPFDSKKMMTALLRDCPEYFYWFDKTCGMSSGVTRAYRAETNPETGEIEIWHAEGSFYSFGFWVADDYCGGSVVIDGETYNYITDSGKTLTVTNALTYAAEIVSDACADDDANKLKAYKDVICREVTYNTDAADETASIAYGDPWQLIYVFDKDPNTNVVCEGYSKAFKFLCDLTDFNNSSINCSIVTGIMSGGTGAGRHMWNLVSIDSLNYLVDVTNCDEGTIGFSDKLFMAGNGSLDDTVFTEYGTPTERYTFTISSNNITYTYDDDTVDIFEKAERLLAENDYEYTDPVDEDNVAPLIDEESFMLILPGEKDYVPTGQRLLLRLKVTDNVGVSAVYVEYDGGSQNGGTTFRMMPVEGEADMYEMVFMLLEYDKLGEWELTGITAGDINGNFRMLDVTNSTLIAGNDGDFTVKGAISEDGISLSSDTFIYSGKIQRPEVTVVFNDEPIILDKDYSFKIRDAEGNEITEPCDAGTYKAIISIKDKVRYCWEDETTEDKEITWKIKPAKAAIPSAKTGLIYNGNTQKGVSANAYCTVTTGSAKNAGNYTAIAKLKDPKNYIWTDGTTADKKISFKIAAKSISDAKVTGLKTKTYSGKAQTQDPTVKTGNIILNKKTDYKLTYKNNIKAGNANYKTLSKTVTISITVK